MSQKAPRQFFQPLAAGAPEPMRDLPVRVERMIQFVPPHLDKVRAKVPGMADSCDVVLGNLEDALPADAGLSKWRACATGKAKARASGAASIASTRPGFWMM